MLFRLAIAGFCALTVTAQASQCFTFADNSARVWRASLTEEQVRVVYVTHSTFRIETAQGVTIATDFAGWAGTSEPPDVVTMNHAHSTHYTDFPDPAIKHVLRGWNPNADGPAEHYLEERDVVVRNVATNIRGWDGSTEYHGNSIFIFEVADLCIGHLGHLHHLLEDEHIAQIGRLDVVMAPVDGTFTLDTPGMLEVLDRLKARVVLPMHYFGPTTLQSFLSGVSENYAVEFMPDDEVVLSLENLPSTPTVMVLGIPSPASIPAPNFDQ
jgi:L-ascorbate metabolism protein UlaG (beta-lactamase superfamily)